MSVVDFPRDGDEDEQPDLYDYTFTLINDEQVTVHGYLVITASLAAIGFGTRGEIKFAAPWNQLKSVSKVEEHRLNG